jgi:hypothetical protein
VIQFVVPFVEWTLPRGRNETLHSTTINVGAHLVGSLRALLLQIFLLTSLKHLKNLPVVKRCAGVCSKALLLEIFLLPSMKHLKNLSVVKMCADHLWSKDQIHVLNRVRRLTCLVSCVCVCACDL